MSLLEGIMTSAPGRYAKALFLSTIQEKQVYEVKEGLYLISKALYDIPEFFTAFQSSRLNKLQKKEVWEALRAKLQIPDTLYNFMGALIEAGRVEMLGKIITLYDELILEDTGQIRVDIQTARPFTTAQEKSLADSLQHRYGRQVIMTIKEDPSMIAGFIVTCGSEVMNASITYQLSQLVYHMRGET